MANRIAIPARKGKAAALKVGQRIRVVNTHGEQVVDTWAFSRADLAEFMSMEHTRASLLRVRPRVGDALYTNRRRPILTLIEDTSPGIHDTVIAARDRWRYIELGVKGFHDSCTDNLAAALAELGLKPPETPSPLNLWMNIPFAADGGLSFDPPVSKKGDYVVFRAEMDAVMAFSACPQDILPINGVGRAPTEAHFEID